MPVHVASGLTPEQVKAYRLADNQTSSLSGWDLYVALGALILQQLHDLTDQQTSEAISLNIAWHYALDIRHEPDAYLGERTQL